MIFFPGFAVAAEAREEDQFIEKCSCWQDSDGDIHYCPKHEAREEGIDNEQKPLSNYTQEELASLDKRMEAGEAELFYAWKVGREKGREGGIDEMRNQSLAIVFPYSLLKEEVNKAAEWLKEK